MAYSYTRGTYPAGTQVFTVPFVYRNKADVKLAIDDVDTTEFTWDSAAIIRLNTALAEEAVVEIRRETPMNERAVDFEAANGLSEADLDDSNIQVFDAAQEGVDVRDYTLQRAKEWDDALDAKFTAEDKRIEDKFDASQAVQDGRIGALESSLGQDTRFVNWLYNGGNANGGELKVYPPYEFVGVSGVFINGLRQTHGLAWDFSTFDFSVELAEPLQKGDEVVVQLGREPSDGSETGDIVIPVVQPRQVSDGVTLRYAAPHDILIGAQSLQVHIDGVWQRPTTDYTTPAMGRIDFVEAPPKGALIDIVFFRPQFFDAGVDVSTSYAKATGSTTNRTLEDRFADVVNVKDFGAIGDGVADDTAAIQAALDSGATTICVPYGRYIITDTTTRTSTNPLRLVGAGTLVFKKSNYITGKAPEDSELKSTDSIRDYCISEHTFMMEVSNASEVELDGVSIVADTEYSLGWLEKYPINKYGGYKSGYLGRVHGIKFLNIGSFKADNIHVEGFMYNGLLMQHETAYIENVIVTNSTFTRNRSCGLRIENARNSIITNNIFKDIGVEGQGNTGYGVSFGQTVSGRKPCLTANVSNNIFQNSCRKFIDSHDCIDMVISDNEFKSAARTYVAVISQFANYTGLINNVTIKGNKGRSNRRDAYHVAAINNAPRQNALDWNAAFPSDTVTVPDDRYDPGGNGDYHVDNRYYECTALSVATLGTDDKISCLTVEGNVFTDESIGNVSGMNTASGDSTYLDLNASGVSQCNIRDNYIDLTDIINPTDVTYTLNNMSLSSDSKCVVKDNSIISANGVLELYNIRMYGQPREIILEGNYFERKSGRQYYINIEEEPTALLTIYDRNNVYRHGSTSASWSANHYGLANEAHRTDAGVIKLTAVGNEIVTSNTVHYEQKKSYGSKVSDAEEYVNLTYIVESGSNANGKYRVYSDGTVEQWGHVAVNTSGDTFDLPYRLDGVANTDVVFTVTRQYGSGSLNTAAIAVNVPTSNPVTNFEINTTQTGNHGWRVITL